LLRQRKPKEGCGWQVVQAELDQSIELLFRDSQAYHLALKLYARQDEVIAGRNAIDLLRKVIAEYMSEDDDHTPLES
jgi:hypothetical protein